MLHLRLTVLSLTVALALCACDSSPSNPTPTTAATPAPTTAAATPPPAVDPTVGDEHYQKALEFEAAGRYVEAKIEVDQAITAGAGRDARLLAAKLAILRNDLDGAMDLLTPLATDATDALVHYNIGLVAQRRDDYNRSRNAYLAALKADPDYGPARFNLAVLTWDKGVKEEAQHHARKYVEQNPADPLSAELRTKMELDPPTPTLPPGDPAAVKRIQPLAPGITRPPAQPTAQPTGKGVKPTRTGSGTAAGPAAGSSAADPLAGAK